MKRPLVLVALLAACQPAPARIVADDPQDALDCRKGFEALAREIGNRPGIVATEYRRGSNAFRDDRTSTLFLVTLPDHPAHPAIFVRGVALTTESSGVYSDVCGYGDKVETDRMIKAYDSFDRLLNAEEACYLCASTRLESPTLQTRYPPPPPPPGSSTP